MLKVSKLTDYAIALLSLMIKETRGGRNAIFTASCLSHETKIPPATTTKVLKMLAKCKFIISSRGTKGGYFLAMGVENISIEEVIRGLEGPIYINDCSKVKRCYAAHICPLKDSWDKANDALRSTLSSIKLSDMIKDNTLDSGNV